MIWTQMDWRSPRAVLEEGIDLLYASDYAGYEQHCKRVVSDARDAGPVFHALRPTSPWPYP